MSHFIQPATGPGAELFLQNCHKDEYPEGFSYIGPNNYVFPANHAKNFELLTNFNVRSSDVYICSFPRSGTTWISEIVWLLKNNLDFGTAKQNYFYERILSLADHVKQSANHPNLDEVESPRVIKAHFPLEMMPTGCLVNKPKMVFIMRNAKDVCVSYFHHLSKMYGYHGNFDSFCEAFLSGDVLYGPYWHLVNSFWPIRHADNVFVAEYEEMLTDLPQYVNRLANFLGTPLTESQLEAACKHCSFSSMSSNKSVNMEHRRQYFEEKFQVHVDEGLFIRKGKSGSWKEEMSENFQKNFDSWIDVNKLSWN